MIGEANRVAVASEFGKRASEENQERYANDLTDWRNLTAGGAIGGVMVIAAKCAVM